MPPARFDGIAQSVRWLWKVCAKRSYWVSARGKRQTLNGLRSSDCVAPLCKVCTEKRHWQPQANRLPSAPSTIERIGSNNINQSEVDWVISAAGQPAGPPNLKKPTTLRGVVGVWNCESSDYIRGRDGACFHAVGFLARSERLEHNQCHGLFLSFLEYSSLTSLSLFCRWWRLTLSHPHNSVRERSPWRNN